MPKIFCCCCCCCCCCNSESDEEQRQIYGAEQNTNMSLNPTVHHYQAAADYLNVKPCDIMEVERKIEKLAYEQELPYCTPEWMDSKCKEEECYPVRHKLRGRAIVITMTEDREGWDSDAINLAKLFKYLHFEVDWHYDLTYKQYMEELKKFAQSEKNAFVDTAWVILMGHGGSKKSKDYILSTDGKPVYIKSTMVKKFNNKTCSSLLQKPKVFIVQMCRGCQADHGVKVTKCKTQADVTPHVKVGTFTDYLSGYATQEGYQSFRQTDTGSWYIQKLVQVFMEKARHTSVTDILQEVTREVQKFESEEGFVQTAEIVSTLSRRFYLFPGVDPSQMCRRSVLLQMVEHI